MFYILIILLSLTTLSLGSDYFEMKCSYGERGSLTATCENATSSFFRRTMYRFDYLDENLLCVNCNLKEITSGSFEIPGNKILKVGLSKCNITGLGRRAFLGLVFLKELDLSSNQIKEVHPETFVGVRKTEKIDLSHNLIETLEDEGFFDVVNIRTLLLDNNKISFIHPNAFKGLIVLQTLSLKNNLLTNFKSIRLPVTFLDLSFNQIKQIKADFSNLNELLELKLTSNKIVNITSESFSSLHNLKYLDLSSNDISLLSPGWFQNLHALEFLDLSHNSINNIEPKAFQNLFNVIHINMSFNLLKKVTTGIFSNLPELNYLNLSNNNIDLIKPNGIFKILTLHTLDLSYNNLTTVDFLVLLSKIPRISYIALHHNHFTCEFKEAISELFEKENIHFAFSIYNSVKENKTCTTNTTSQEVEHAFSKFYYSYSRESSNSWAYGLLTVMFAFLTFLFVLQFKVAKQLRLIK